MWSANQDPVKQNWKLRFHGFLSIVKGKMYAQKHHSCKLPKEKYLHISRAKKKFWWYKKLQENQVFYIYFFF